MGISGRDFCFLYPPQCATSGTKLYFLPITTSSTQQENRERVSLFSVAVFHIFEDLSCLEKVKESFKFFQSFLRTLISRKFMVLKCLICNIP